LVQHNKAAARILPFEFHDVQERPVWACVRESEIAAFIQQTIENEDSATAREFGVEEFSGTRFLSISVMPLVRSKSVRGTIITIEDVTWKKNEELRNRRLESLASLTNLAATVAHEIKNPLGSISIYVQLLRKSLARIPDGTPEELVQYLDIIDEEIERLNRIVVDFLFAVRPLKFEFTSLDLNLIIQSLAAFMSEELSHASVTLILDLAQSLPHIQGDDRFLRQMLINLIQNSLAAMPTGGTISIATSQTDDVITLTVSDTGTGIPADVIDRIFEPYFTTKADGTGLGLAMAYKVVKEHGGDIYVQSEVGKGTCFRITLPAVRKALKMIEYEEE
jgi:signal transduction histidine kinase